MRRVGVANPHMPTCQGDILFDYGPGTQYLRVSGARNQKRGGNLKRGGEVSQIIAQRHCTSALIRP